MRIPGLHLSAGYLLALGLTLLIEPPVVAALHPGRRRRMAAVCGVTTTFTHLLLAFAFPRVLAPVPALLAGEAFATLAEAAAYWAVSRLPGPALVASAVANGLSFAAGAALLR